MEYRVEKKFLCSEQQLQLLQARLLSAISWDSHQGENDRYLIRSVYFDNFDNSLYYENDAGVDDRSKYRIRAYNCGDDVIHMEIKSKLHGYCHKESATLTRPEFEQIMAGEIPPYGKDRSKTFNRFCLQMAMHRLHPAVIVEYERTAFVYPVGNVRITFDRNISYSYDFGSFFDSQMPATPILPVNRHILEVKYDEILPDFLAQLLELNSLQQSTFSKYYMARQLETENRR